MANGSSNMKVINILINPEMLDFIDELARADLYSGRSDLFRCAIRQYISDRPTPELIEKNTTAFFDNEIKKSISLKLHNIYLQELNDIAKNYNNRSHASRDIIRHYLDKNEYLHQYLQDIGEVIHKLENDQTVTEA